MAASWPLSKKTFSQVVNGVTKLVGLLWNVNYDETEALQIFLGASGNAQTKLAALNRLFKYMLNPLPTITWIDNDTIEISTCSMLMHSGNNYVIKENTSGLQIKLSADLDTGSEAANTWYDVFLVGDGSSSTYTAKFVLQGNTPSGATYYKKIFAIRNDNSSNILKFFHRRFLVMWDVPIQLTTTVSAGAWSSALSCSVAIPFISTLAIFGVKTAHSDNALTGIWLRPNGSTFFSNPTAYPEDGFQLGTVSSATSIDNMGSELICMTDGSQQIQYYQYPGSDSCAISVKGYFIDVT